MLIVWIAGAVTAFWMRTLPVADGDLQLVIPEVARENNAFIGLLEATAALKLGGRDSRLLNSWTVSSNVSEVLRGIVTSNQAALRLAKAAWQRPEFLAEGALQFTTHEVEYLDHWKQLARLTAVNAVVAFEAGHESEALATAESIVAFGCRIKESPAPFLHFLVGESIERLGLELIRRFASQGTLPDSSLADLLARLGRLPSVETAMTNAMRGEYVSLCSEMDDLWRIEAPLGINRSATAAMMARDFRQILALVPLTYQQAIPRRPQRTTKPGFLRQILKGNLVGSFLADTIAARGDSYIRSKSRSVVHREATRAFVALALHRRKHGQLPETLSELVPGLLPALPRDDFDGGALRYDRGRRILYSVGVDLKDDAGRPPARGREGGDLVFSIP